MPGEHDPVPDAVVRALVLELTRALFGAQVAQAGRVHLAILLLLHRRLQHREAVRPWGQGRALAALQLTLLHAQQAHLEPPFLYLVTNSSNFGKLFGISPLFCNACTSP